MPEAAVAPTPTAVTPPPDTGTPAATPPASATAPGTSHLRPIPVASKIPQLPGVIPDEGDAFPPMAEPPPAASSPPARDAQGRFIGTTPTQDGDHTGQAATSSDSQTAEPEFEIAGEKHKSQAEFEQQYKSLKGNFKPLQALAKTLGGLDNVLPAIQKSVASANAWKADSETKGQRITALEAELAAARGGQPATKAGDSAGAQSEGDIDWELYAEIRRVATESGEPWKADQWLDKQRSSRDQARIEKLLGERMKPLDEERQQTELEAQTGSLFASLGEAKNTDGTLAYPELHDEASAFAVGRLWASMGLPPEAALTPQGAVAAIAVYRMARAGTQAAVQPTGTTDTTGAGMPPGEPSDAASAATLTDGRPSNVVRADSSLSTEAANVLAGLRRVNTDSKRAVLGFSE